MVQVREDVRVDTVGWREKQKWFSEPPGFVGKLRETKKKASREEDT